MAVVVLAHQFKLLPHLSQHIRILLYFILQLYTMRRLQRLNELVTFLLLPLQVVSIQLLLFLQMVLEFR